MDRIVLLCFKMLQTCLNCYAYMFNITLMFIDLGVDTHACTHMHIPTSQAKAISRNQACASLWPVPPGLMIIEHCIYIHYIFIDVTGTLVCMYILSCSPCTDSMEVAFIPFTEHDTGRVCSTSSTSK